MAPDRHIVLIGLPGAGKTSIGRQLARMLRRPFADADEQLELAAGRTVTRLVHEHGVDELHRRERQTLVELLQRYGPLVISAPGGIEIHDTDRALLARAAVVLWIHGPIDLLAELGDPTHRPRLAEGQLDALARFDRELSPVYRDVADHVVDIAPFHGLDGEPRQAIAHHIVELLTDGDDAATPPELPEPPAGTERELSARFERVADLVVEVEPFHDLDGEPKRTITRHILGLLADHGIHPPDPDGRTGIEPTAPGPEPGPYRDRARGRPMTG